MFKKIMSLVLALMMVIGLVACGGSGTGTTSGAVSGAASNSTSGTTSEPKQLKDTVNIALIAAVESTDPMANTKDATMQNFQWVYESPGLC